MTTEPKWPKTGWWKLFHSDNVVIFKDKSGESVGCCIWEKGAWYAYCEDHRVQGTSGGQDTKLGKCSSLEHLQSTS